ncbi:hypothetical protein [uncultured Arthrobacter sp.]|uniref:hypothetical protein n=1 Tax=uncultured Arthrobacter sp. TaxID=114050 RepID=UPI003217BDC7
MSNSDLEPTLIEVAETEKGIMSVVYGDGGDDSEYRTQVCFNPDSVDISGYWSGNDGEWTGEWLGANFDRAAVEHLRDHLSAWLEQTA